MPELLAPAGSWEACLAAIANGADAIYLGLNCFSARAYAQNFTLENIKEVIDYCHLRHVLVYVAMNTILFEDELTIAFNTIDQLYQLGVDGIIIQDLALLQYLKKYPDLETHISTQMGIDDLEGASFLKDHDVKRIVLAREVPIEKALMIKKLTGLEIELFVHGALCVAYSGNCLMSGLIGYRSGNRGRCVGSCRKLYQVKNLDLDIVSDPQYFLNMKDLNTTNYLKQLEVIDSLKIEGRMKDPSYVATVIKVYRQLLDSKDSFNSELEITQTLSKTFQRTFTKGYLFKEAPIDIINLDKPNNFGFLVGKVTGFKKEYVEITLSSLLRQHDQIRIDSKQQEINLPLTKIYNQDGLLINQSDQVIYLKINENVSLGSKVYQTKDQNYLDQISKSYYTNYRLFPLTMRFDLDSNLNLFLNVSYLNYQVTIVGQEPAQIAKTKATTYQDIYNQLSKLGDTVYYLDHLESNINNNDFNNVFIPLKLLNQLRRDAISQLDQLRLTVNRSGSIEVFTQPTPTFEICDPQLVIQVLNDEQYQACLDLGIDNDHIYYHNIIPRNQSVSSNNRYPKLDQPALIGGIGGLTKYQEIISDYSFNVVNSESVGFLHRNGVKRVTLSYELNKKQINDLIEGYYQKYQGYPNLELIVYGRQPLMVTKACPLPHLNQCGQCKKYRFNLIDDHQQGFPLVFNQDCQVTIYNSKTLNLASNLKSIRNINYYRLNFTTEGYDQVKKVITTFQNILNGFSNSDDLQLFDSATQTRGHFNREIH